ncbi:MAG: hypothetical protein ACRDMV_01880 [Streptosporangiales bacterium]
MTLPALSVSRPDGLVSGLVDHAQHAAEQYARWPMADWRVDGADVPARVWRFADGWAAIIDVLPDVYLAAAGVGTPVDGIAVATVHDATPYGFDLREPLSMQALRRSESTRPEGAHVPTVREPADWHPDQLAVPRRAHSDDR